MKPLLFILLAGLLTMACGHDNTKGESVSGAAAPPSCVSSDSVMAVYSRYVNGDYAGYVDAMQSCDDKPESYRQQMSTLLKQHAVEKQKADGKVMAVEVVRITPVNKGLGAEAYLNVTYEKRATEEIFLQFVYDGERWRLR